MNGGMDDRSNRSDRCGAGLSTISVLLCELLARGLSPGEIEAACPAVRAADWQICAAEALRLHAGVKTRQQRVAKILSHYPRAYEKWCPPEEQKVAELYRGGKTLREIAAAVQRQPQAVKCRLQKMGLFT